MATTPGQLAAQLLERFTPDANEVEFAIEETMKSLTHTEHDGSFEFAYAFPERLNPTVLRILNERYGRPDKTGWELTFHPPDLIEMMPQTPPKR